MTKPIDRYRKLFAERSAARQQWGRAEFRVSILRLVVMLAIFVLAWIAVQNRAISLLWVALPVAVFFVLISWHERLLQRKRRARQACAFYQAGIDRIEERWRSAEIEDGDRFRSPDHPYADDLDVLGQGSLYHLLNQTRTRTGEETLANWLLAPAGAEEVVARQAAVAELMLSGDLREEMATLGSEVRSALDPQRLSDWGTGSAPLAGVSAFRWVFAGLAIANVSFAVLWIAGVVSGRPLLLSCLVSFVLFLLLRVRIGTVVDSVEQASRDLSVIAELMDRLEREKFQAPWLRQRSEELRLDGAKAGDEIRRLLRWAQRLESRRNAFFAPFGALVLWTSQIAFVVEGWRKRWGGRVARWLQVIGELEAAACLGTFAYERELVNPPDASKDAVDGAPKRQVTFPEVIDHGPALMQAEALGHPLIAPELCVRNDVSLAVASGLEAPAEAPQALVISGSNMSGKSTFLRACGLNVVLAWAGAPVVATRFRTSPLVVGASIRIQDSLQEGKSKFYAEIQRLRRILDLARGQVPALCLLDEILHGTNSHDRRIGAAAVVKALLEQDALVMVTTHDLVLARLTEQDELDADSRGGESVEDSERAAERRLRNVHFVDTIDDGGLHFDYSLRPGVVEKSNALELMRQVGLDV